MSSSVSKESSTWCFLDHSDDTNETNEIPIQVPFLIGRRSNSDLPLDCTSVSGAHAELLIENDEIWIEDLDSTNGTFVNGVRIGETRKLQKGDVVQFGSMVFQVARNKDKASPVIFRDAVQTIESDIPESPEGRFHRLLRVGVVPFFQPVFNIATDEIAGYEVLGRGRMPGLCTPEEMFAAAFKMEKTVELSESLRKHGIEVADANFSSGKLIFVNTHSYELLSDRLGESLARIRAVYPDRNFILEIPATILEVSEKMSVIDAATRDLNIDLSVYDLNCDIVQLAKLQQLAPKVVKVSVDLIRDIEKANHREHKLISTIVKMLLELDIQPMAEKVETAGEHETIKQLGFQLAQGYHYGEPSSIEDCLEPGSTAASDRQRSHANPSQGDSSVSKRNGSLMKVNSNVTSSEESESVVQEGINGAKWVLEQPKEYFTIQVMVTISKSGAEEYVAKQEQPENFMIYPKKGKRRDLFVVVHGSYTSRDAARVVSEELKDSTSFPLIRMFANVQSEVQSRTY